jgi:hypothetical protein
MRLILMLSAVLFAGCAFVTPPAVSGSQMKNGGPIRVERLGTTMFINTSDELTCGDDYVSWCTGSRSRKSCQCLTIHEAEQRARRTLGQLHRRQH